jgi:hypothetical protein
LHAVKEILRADFLPKDDKNDQGVYLFGGKMGSSVQIGVRGHCLACGGLERAFGRISGQTTPVGMAGPFSGV